MAFEPKPKNTFKEALPMSRNVGVHFRGESGEQELSKIRIAAAKKGMSISAFCRQAILYALDNMEDD